MSDTSYAVAAKARSKYGRFLSDRDYDSILACESVPEVMVYLKTYTHFASALSEADERDVHRGRLEILLRRYQFDEIGSLCRYDSVMSAGFSRFVVERTEVEQIVRFLILLNSNATERFMFQYPVYLSKHTELDPARIAAANSYDEFLEALQDTPYYELLLPFKPDEKGRLAISDIENALYAAVSEHLLDFIRRKTQGDERRELSEVFRTINNYSIISRILRMKRYYHLPPETIKANIKTEFCSLKPALVAKLIAAESADKAFRLIRDSRYGKLLEQIGFTGEGDPMPAVQYLLAKRYLHFSRNPSVVMLSFIFLSETELMNVIRMIEGIRYQVDPKTIRSLLIR